MVTPFNIRKVSQSNKHAIMHEVSFLTVENILLTRENELLTFSVLSFTMLIITNLPNVLLFLAHYFRSIQTSRIHHLPKFYLNLVFIL